MAYLQPEISEGTPPDPGLVSLMMAQIAENKGLAVVFEELFDSRGMEVRLLPAPCFVVTGRPVDFDTVVESARRQGQTAFGYRIAALANETDRAYGVRVNPVKSERTTFAPDDKIIVLTNA